MPIVFKFMFERLTDPLGLPISAIWEYIILIAIGEIAYLCALKLVGNLYNSGEIHSSGVGSLVHWIIRLFLFVVMWTVIYLLIKLVKFLAVCWLPTLIGLLGIVLVSVLIVFIIKTIKKRRVA